MTAFGLGVPERRPFGQPQLGPPPAGLPLLAGQPVADRGDEVVVRQLVVPARRSGLLRALGFGPFGIGRRDQPHLVVEGPQQVAELVRACAVSRRHGQVVMRTHVALDGRAALGEQGFQHALGGLLVTLQRGRAERLFEECDANPLGATDVLEGRQGPRPALDHLGEQGQADRDHPPILRQSLDGLGEEALLVPGERPIISGQCARTPCRTRPAPCVRESGRTGRPGRRSGPGGSRCADRP